MTLMAMADAEHRSVRRRRTPLRIEDETDETANARKPRPKPLNTDTTTYQPRFFIFDIETVL
jgi:hypothetical protein